MADASKNVNININTKADTSGAEKAATSLKKVNDAANQSESRGFGGMLDEANRKAKEQVEVQAEIKTTVEDTTKAAQRALDVETAKGNIRNRAVKSAEAESAAVIKTAQNTAAVASGVAAVATAAKFAVDEVSSLANRMAELDPEWARRYSVELETLNMLAHPLDSLWAALTDHASEALDGLEAANKRLAATSVALAKMQAERKAAVDAANSNSMEGVFGRELAAIEAETSALNRQIAVQNSKAAAVEAAAKLQDAMDIRNGADPNKVAANAALRGQGSQNTAIDQKLAEAQQAFQSAQEREQAVIEKLGYAVSINSKNKEDISKQAEVAGRATEEALLNLRAAQEIADQQKLAVAAATQNTILDLGITATADFATKLKETVDGLVPINAAQAEAKTIAEDALSNGQLTSDEMLKVGAALQLLMATLKTGQETSVGTIQSLIDMQRSVIANQNVHDAQIKALQGQIKSSGNIR